MATYDQIRQAAEADLATFIRLVAPHRVLGQVHLDVLSWWTREDASSHQMLLMPRDHQKSALAAYRVAWEITRDPTKTVLYISSTSTLAQKQLYFIKQILDSKIYRRYWPNHLHPEEGKREKWTEHEINLDHPARKEQGIRDSTIFTAGLTTSITGLHFDIAVLDDVVVKENAYTEEGRSKVMSQYSLLSSIESGEALEIVVGTRYHPKDLYGYMLEIEEDVYDEDGELVGSIPVYECLQFEVEDIGDGSGEFLWPRMQRSDGKWFGFNRAILAKKRAKYLDKTQYYAQYYNNPHNPEGSFVKREYFNYYDRKHLTQGDDGYWYYKNRRLNVFAAIDFAFSLRKGADATALAVVGVDYEGNYYVLEINRFKTDRISDYYDKIALAHSKWGFRKIRAEVNIAQQAIVRELKDNYIKRFGLALSVDEYRPNRHEGHKLERISATLRPRYENGAIWHYRTGNIEYLEEELTTENPAHDDCMDALANAIDIAVIPRNNSVLKNKNQNVIYHSRFGGVAI